MTILVLQTNTNPEKKMTYRMIDGDLAVAGQLQPAELDDLVAAVFKTIICARPDGEEPGQPTFATIERAARAKGLNAVYIPVSGGVDEGAVIRMKDALRTMPKPIYGYCRSGGRAGSLYSAALQATR